MKIMCGNTDLTSRLLSYKRRVYFPEHRLIGNAPTAKLEIELLNEDGVITEELLQNAFTITEGSVKTGVFLVIEKPQKYTKKLSLKLYDKMIKLDIPYKSLLDYSEGTIISEQLTEMQQLAGVTIDKTNLPSIVLNKSVGWIDTTYSIRTYLGWIAELAGMNAMCDNTGTIRFYDLSTTADYTTTDLSDYSTDEMWTVGRVCFDDGLSVYSYPSSTENNTLYISSKNLYFNCQDDVQFIYNKYQSLSVMIAKSIKMPGIDGIRLGQIIEYNSLFSFIVLDLTSSFVGGSYCDHEVSGELETKESEGTVIRYDDSIRIKKVQTTVDNVNQQLSIVAEDTDKNKSDIAQIKIDTQSIESSVSSIETKVNNSVKSYAYSYGYGTSDTTHPADSVFTYTTMPPKVDGKYIWRKTVITKTNDTTSSIYEMIQGVDGVVGRSITSAEPLYYLKQDTYGSPTAPSAPTAIVTSESTGSGVWTKRIPDYVPPTMDAEGENPTQAYYYWTCTQIIYDDNTFSFSDVILDDNLSDLQLNVTKMNTSIVQTNSMVASLATAESVTELRDTLGKLSSRVDTQQSSIDQNRSKIALKVTQTDIDTSVREANKGLQEQINEINKSMLTVNSKEITALVSAVNGTEGNPGLIDSVNDLKANSTAFQVRAVDPIDSTKEGGTYVFKATVNQDGTVTYDEQNYTKTDTKGQHIFFNGQEVTWNTVDGTGTTKLSIGDNADDDQRWQFVRAGDLLNISWHSDT